MRFGVDDPLVRGVHPVTQDGVGQGVHVAVVVARRLQGGADGMDEAGVPLRTEAEPAVLARSGKGGIALHVFGDENFPRLPRAQVGGHGREEAAATPKAGGGIADVAVSGADVLGGVKAQTVDAKHLQPLHRRIPEEVADVLAVIVRPGGSPRGEGAAVVVEVAAAVASISAAVEAP